MLTALGVGGLAVALALQETLSNLFAGLFVSAAGHVRVGDYIRLDTGDCSSRCRLLACRIARWHQGAAATAPVERRCAYLGSSADSG